LNLRTSEKKLKTSYLTATSLARLVDIRQERASHTPRCAIFPGPDVTKPRQYGAQHLLHWLRYRALPVQRDADETYSE
jgi:hypothetical protein